MSPSEERQVFISRARRMGNGKSALRESEICEANVYTYTIVNVPMVI